MNKASFAGCTIIAKNQLSMARVLAQSWYTYHPGNPFFVLLLDSATGFFRRECECFRVVPSAQLQIPNLPGFFFRHSQREAASAAKPFFFLHLLDQYSLEGLVYLAPGSLVLSPLDHLTEMLDRADVVLTAHITSPLPRDKAAPSEADILQSGIYAPGFLAFRESSNCRQILQWWSDSMSDAWGASSDQDISAERWIDLVPQIFQGVEVTREPGYNVGYWNLHDHHVRMDGQKVLVNEEPAYLFNFRGFDPNRRAELAVLQSWYQMNDVGDAADLFSRYYDLLMEAGWRETSRWTYTHDFFRSGPIIPPSARRYYRSLGPCANELGDPFTWIKDTHLDYGQDATDLASEAGLPFGMNVIGYLRSEKGVGEMVRSNLRVLEAAHIPFVANDFIDSGSENVEESPVQISGDNPYKANLITINADILPYFGKINPRYMRQRFNIGYWAWELPEFPHKWTTAFGYLDEVWTPSRFARDSIASSSRVPVQVVHCALDQESVPGPGWSRASFGIPEDTFEFLFMFDFHSFMERKNPLGLIQAFKSAFGGRNDVSLVIKSSHAQEYPLEMRMLKEAAFGANVHVIDKVYSRDAKNGLMNTADCYVSLHRSEGFGLTLAEAMFCGKPVIATNYSGNTDFMSSENSFLVPYRIATINRAHGSYAIGTHWADPDLDYAVDVLRYIERNRETASEIGRRGRHHVSTVLHPATIGRSVFLRLQELGLLA